MSSPSAMPSRREDEITNAMDIDEETVDSPQPTHHTPASRSTNVLSKLIESDSESGADAPVQPRRKLLSALKPQITESSSESEEDDNGEGAYERIKAQLMSGTSQPEPKQTSRPAPTVPDVASSEDEDEMPVRANHRRPVVRRDSSVPPQLSPSPSARSRRSSPGLFVTPNASPVKKTAPRPLPSAGSEPDEPAQSASNADLEERVKRIRAERKAQQNKARDQEKCTKKAPRRAAQDSDSDPDGETGRRLTQQARPTRKASKKALEDISREQQRIARNMQLTHQAKTKKRYTTKDLLATFGFNQTIEEPTVDAQLPTPDASSVLASSDAEANQTHDSPPMSPPSEAEAASKDDVARAPQEERVTSPPRPRMDKGKGRAPEFQHLPVNPLAEQARLVTVHNARSSPKKPTTAPMVELSDSEDDLEIVKPKSRFPVFDRLPEQREKEAPSLLHLRHLAHLTTNENPRKDKRQNVMNLTDLQVSLAQKARQQANKERAEKIADLQRRGIHIETQEEREKQQLEIEDLVAQFEKARQEDLKLSKLERGEAKKNGETGDDLPSSDDDEDYVGSGEEDAAEAEGDDEADGEVEEEAELELSGSEEEDLEDEADDEEEVDDDAAAKSNALIDEMADEDDEEPDQANDDEDMEDDAVPAVRKRTANRARNIIVDDEDESESEAAKQSISPQQCTSAAPATQDNVMAAFGFNNVGSTLGLTQVFAGTMANFESNSQDAHPLGKEPEQDSLDFLRSLPDSQPVNDFSQASELLVPNSQALESQQEPWQAGPMNFGISQLIQTSPDFSQSQLSEMPEPTQDVGFGLPRSPAGLIPPPSTNDTVMMAVAESPIMKKKGKLQQRKHMVITEESDVEAASESEAEDDSANSHPDDAFTIMKEAAKKKQATDDFNKKTSYAREVVEEQAEESEDEYAGIGGADGEDSDEDDEELAKMIDTADVKVDERKMAAFFAEKSKKEDELAMNKLYKDVMGGGLRRKRGQDGAFDMSDSEDEAEQRRRKKQMQFKQMTKALIADDRIGQIAQNPKKSAFFNTLADHMEDPEYEFLNAPEMEIEPESSESQSQSNENGEANETEMSIPDSQADATTASASPLKRKSLDSQEKENRPPPNLRRTAATSDTIPRKPISFADVQTSVMELLEDPRIMVPDSQYSDSESETESFIPKSRKPIIDRLTLSRTASIDSESAVFAEGNLAFHAPTAGTGPGFKVPSLIRRATSNLSDVVRTNSGSTTPSEGSVRRGGTGRSNIHAQAREAERRAVLEKTEKKRKESMKKKVSKAKGKRSILRDLGGGFE